MDLKKKISKRIILIKSILILSIITIFFIANSLYNKIINELKLQKKHNTTLKLLIGKKVIINKDTLIITGYDNYQYQIYLSNSTKANLDFIQTKIIEDD